MKWLFAAWIIFSSIAFAHAASMIGNISATVITDVQTIEQTDNGVKIVGQEPLYCDTGQIGNVICYY